PTCRNGYRYGSGNKNGFGATAFAVRPYGIAERSEQKGVLYRRGNIEHCPKPVRKEVYYLSTYREQIHPRRYVVGNSCIGKKFGSTSFLQKSSRKSEMGAFQ